MKNYTLNYNKAAEATHKGWERTALPIGNGYMGMSIFGGVDKESLQMNEKTLWIGGPSDKRPDYYGGNLKDKTKYLKEMQEILQDKNGIVTKNLIDNLVGKEEGYGNYINFGYLDINFGHNNPSNYTRSLNISEAVARVSYANDGVKFERVHFANYPHNVLVSMIKADKKELNCSLSFRDLQKDALVKAEGKKVEISGKVEDNGLEYYGLLKIETDGEVKADGSTLNIFAAQYLVIYLSIGTDYKNEYPKYRGESPIARIQNVILNSEKFGYDKLLKEHIDDYKKYFDRNSLELTDKECALTTDELLQKYKRHIAVEDEKRYLEELLYAYGRYLIIGSSRIGSLPANLQGVWNDSNNPPWGSDYHLNVNLQMCYWHIYSTNLSELAIPMIEYMESLRVPGRITAKEYHGIESKDHEENGWVCHVQNTPFGFTCPGWSFYWGWSPASSSWMLLNCFEYYEYTKDVDMLKKLIYPTMKENAKFWIQALIFDKEQDRYVSSPSFSPEHGPITTGNTYEQELIWLLFDATIKAGKVLKDDETFLVELAKIKDKLKPLNIGKFGQLKEWYEEDDWYSPLKVIRRIKGLKRNCEPGHRHMSHMMGLYPGSHIVESGKKWMDACKVSIMDRGFSRAQGRSISGWGKAYRILLWARLKEGNNAYAMIEGLLQNNIASNLWDLHPPFQMDGNCGYTAGVAEMLLYSSGEYIELLPALPTVWKNGEVKGLLAKGGYTVDIAWKNGAVTKYKIVSKESKNIKIVLGCKTIDCVTNKLIECQ